MRLLAILTAFVCVCGGTTYADTTDVPKPVDTLVFIPTLTGADTAIVIDTINLERHLYQNPTAALFKSLLVPGYGQMGNGRFFKGILFAGLECWFITSALRHNNTAQIYRQRYENATALVHNPAFSGVSVPSYFTVTGPSVILSQRRDSYHQFEYERGQRNKFLWYAGITAFVSIFDAYVDAHLSGSPFKGKQHSLGVEITPNDRGGTDVRFSLRF